MAEVTVEAHAVFIPGEVVSFAGARGDPALDVVVVIKMQMAEFGIGYEYTIDEQCTADSGS